VLPFSVYFIACLASVSHFGTIPFFVIPVRLFSSPPIDLNDRFVHSECFPPRAKLTQFKASSLSLARSSSQSLRQAFSAF